MNDSADMKLATAKVDDALERLESTITPMLEDLARLRAQAGQSSSLDKDRAALAQQLDESKAREIELKKRHQELSQMADEAIADLDAVIAQVKTALSTA